jgi:hypothetical protein
MTQHVSHKKNTTQHVSHKQPRHNTSVTSNHDTTRQPQTTPTQNVSHKTPTTHHVSNKQQKQELLLLLLLLLGYDHCS